MSFSTWTLKKIYIKKHSSLLRIVIYNTNQYISPGLHLPRVSLTSLVYHRANWAREQSPGVLSGKVGTRMCGPDRVPFRSLRFTNGRAQMAAFYLKIDLDRGCVFAKCLILDEFFICIAIGCQKVLMQPNLHGKSSDWFKKVSSRETNVLDMGCKFVSSLLYL